MIIESNVQFQIASPAEQKRYLKSLRTKKTSLSVVITGGTRGLGKSMAQTFVENGDRVFVVSRNARDVNAMKKSNPLIYGCTTDVSNPEQVKRMFANVQDAFGRGQDGGIDLFVNCAALSGGFKRFDEHNEEKISNIIGTNLTGTAMCCSRAFDVMKTQPQGGAIYNFLGNGSNGWASPNYSVYGSTKSAIKQLTKSLQREWKGSVVDLHQISPGLMITDLLMENLSPDTFEYIKALCSTPEHVARHIVPRMRATYYSAKDEHTIKFLTNIKIVYKMFFGALNKP